MPVFLTHPRGNCTIVKRSGLKVTTSKGATKEINYLRIHSTRHPRHGQNGIKEENVSAGNLHQ
jgi:hypothetical protein